MKNNYLLLLFFVFSIGCSASSQKNETTIPSDNKDVKPLILIFAGDVMNHMPQTYAAYVPSTKKYDYQPCFQYIKQYIESADISFCNLEFPLAGKPYSGYPKFSGPDEVLEAVQWAGFDVIFTANNHMMDKGNQGNQRTLSQINKRNLKFAGSYTGKQQKDSIYPLFIEKNGVKIAVLNYTYNLNLPIAQPSIVNLLDSISIIRDIEKAKSLSADFIIAAVHWGDEYQLKNSAFQKKWSNFLVNNGVDLIIGSHPHVVQNFEIIQHNEKSVPVFYSLGNFVSNQRERNQNGGILARIEIDTTHKIVQNISYHPFYVYKGIINNTLQYYLIPTDDYINNHSLFSIPPKDSVELMYFHNKTKETLNNIPTYQERL